LHCGGQYASMNLEALGEWIAARNESASAADAPPSPPVAAGEVGEGPESEVRVAVDPVTGVAALYGRVELDDVVGAENRCVSAYSPAVFAPYQPPTNLLDSCPTYSMTTGQAAGGCLDGWDARLCRGTRACHREVSASRQLAW